jgi:tetrahydromethanopterin S-methyltransferase subunit F
MATEQRFTGVREVADTNDNASVTRQNVVTRDRASSGVVAKRVVYYVLGIVVAFLLLRFVLLLLAANQGNAFVDFVYAVGGFFAAPFFGIFSYTPVYGSSVFEISTLVAIAVYSLVAWGIAKLFTLGSNRTV